MNGDNPYQTLSKEGILSKFENMQGGFHPPCEKGQGGFILVAKKTWGDYIHLYKNDQGDSVREGFCPYP